jgi:hypothetical protein
VNSERTYKIADGSLGTTWAVQGILGIVGGLCIMVGGWILLRDFLLRGFIELNVFPLMFGLGGLAYGLGALFLSEMLKMNRQIAINSAATSHLLRDIADLVKADFQSPVELSEGDVSQ